MLILRACTRTGDIDQLPQFNSETPKPAAATSRRHNFFMRYIVTSGAGREGTCARAEHAGDAFWRRASLCDDP